MIVSVSLCVLMVSAVWAQGKNGMIRLNNVTDCKCWPDTYTALAWEKSAYLKTGSTDPLVIDSMFTMDFSYTVMKSRLVGMMRDPTTKIETNVTMYQNYKTGKSWTYDGTTCKERPILNSLNPVQCGRANNTHYFGTYKLAGMLVNTMAGPTSDGLAQEYFHMSQDCEPVSYVRVGAIMRGNDPNPVRELEDWTYANYRPNEFSEKTDPFTMPDLCTMGAAPVGKRSVDTEKMIEKLHKVPFPSL